MLSVVDLLDAGTLDLDLAAYLAAAISRGASFLVGAVPGGAGKTTVMAALLNFVPPDCRLAAADSGATVRRALSHRPAEPTCFICHEIGAGPYFAYLWGRDARDFFALTRAGYTIATNLHADTIEQCRDQLCRQNGVADDDFHRCNLCMFLSLSGRNWFEQRRRIAAVYESDGRSPHRLVARWNPRTDSFERPGQSRLVPPDDPHYLSLRDFLAELARADIRTVEEVRGRFLEFSKHRQAQGTESL